jgi:stage II sporulation protein Q
MVAEVMKMKEEEKKHSSNQQPSWLKKRWLYPTVYIAVAALIITAALWMQGNQQAVDEEDYSFDDYVQYPKQPDVTEGQPVNNATEMVNWPVLEMEDVTVMVPFYDPQASEEEQEAAIVVYNNMYFPNEGIDLVTENGEAFDVVAAMSGKVVRAEKDPLLGFVVEIEHDNNLITHYNSLADLRVAVDEEVKQGQLLGVAGRNVYNQEAGVHLHFELRHNNGEHVVAMNPINYFNQPITSVPGEKDDKKDDGDKDKEDKKEEEDQSHSDDDGTEGPSNNEDDPSAT